MNNIINKKFSIITASYNYEKYIIETIQCVINQSIKDWEMIIIDDGSKDNSIEIIKLFCSKDHRIKLYQHRNGANKGLIETLKLGLSVAKGEWIIFLESDDTITPDYLEEKLKVIKKYPNIGFIFNDINLFGDEDSIKLFDDYICKSKKALNEITYPAKIANLFKEYNPVPTFSTVMVKKELLKNLKWNSPVPQWIDYYLWSQLAREYEFYYINKKLTNFRIHKSSYNNKKINLYKTLYFLKIVIAENIKVDNTFTDKLKFFKELFILIRKRIIKFHPKENEIIIFGKKYRII